jgi:hypothetical protein
MATPKVRGGWLDMWMFLMLIVNIGALLWQVLVFLGAYTAANGSVAFTVADWSYFVNTFLFAWTIASLTLLFLWRKVGFFCLCGSTLAAVIIDLYVGASAFYYLGVLGVVILGVLLRPKWASFS